VFTNEKIWTVSKIRPERLGAVNQHVNTIMNNKARYKAAEALCGVPWFVIGILHGLEADYNFHTILANGDPLGTPTHHEPRGLIAHTWEEGVVISFTHEKYMHLTGWNLLSLILDRIEAYNGMGYRNIYHVPSPYLYSFTNVYTRGKYDTDEHFNPWSVSQQCGAVAILLRMVQLNILTVQGNTMIETVTASVPANGTTGLNTANSAILSAFGAAFVNGMLGVNSSVAILLHGQSWWHVVSAAVTFGAGAVGAAMPIISLLNANAASILNTAAALAEKAVQNVDASTGK